MGHISSRAAMFGPLPRLAVCGLMLTFAFVPATPSLAQTAPQSATPADATQSTGTAVAFAGLRQDPTLPVDIAADQLTFDQTNGTASFVGNVIITQGEMRLSAGSVAVEYAMVDGTFTGRIARLLAEGGVIFVAAEEAAEAQSAAYDVDAGQVTMSGGVILTQGANAISAQSLVIDLTTGRGVLEGRVRTTLRTDLSK